MRYGCLVNELDILKEQNISYNGTIAELLDENSSIFHSEGVDREETDSE